MGEEFYLFASILLRQFIHTFFHPLTQKFLLIPFSIHTSLFPCLSCLLSHIHMSVVFFELQMGLYLASSVTPLLAMVEHNFSIFVDSLKLSNEERNWPLSLLGTDHIFALPAIRFFPCQLQQYTVYFF